MMHHRFFGLAALLLAALAQAVTAAGAQSRVAAIRDAEIEALLRDYARPVMQAAGIRRAANDIVLVADPGFNAFVSGRRMFINTGLLLATDTPNEVIGVIAHEAGHLAGGHQHRLREQIERAKMVAALTSLLGAGMMAAGGSEGASALGVGIAAAGPGAALRGLLAYQRSEEMAADRAALTYLEKTGQSAAGMLATFERMARGQALSGVRADPYTQTHPMPRERITFLATEAGKSRAFAKADAPALQLRHDLARAKVAGYEQGPAAVTRLFRNDPNGLPARYGLAVSAFLRGSPGDALARIDGLIASQPGSPYFQELRGEALLKAGRAAQAATAFDRAVSLDAGKSPLLRVRLGFALLSTGDPARLDAAIRQLQLGLDADPDHVLGYRHLSTAYGRKGDIGRAELSAAEGHIRAGNLDQARIFAARAQSKLKKNSPAWRRAGDIVAQRRR